MPVSEIPTGEFSIIPLSMLNRGVYIFCSKCRDRKTVLLSSTWIYVLPSQHDYKWLFIPHGAQIINSGSTGENLLGASHYNTGTKAA